MARTTQIDKRIAELESEIATRQHAIAVLRSVQKAKPAAKPRKAVSRKRDQGEGATTDSGNLHYPPA